MDLNQLLSAHQLAVMKIGPPSDRTDNRTQSERVADYADRIERLRDHQASGGLDDIESWESEGGSVPDPGMALPFGLTMNLRPEYRVGPYVYSDLALAKMELRRQKNRLGA